VRNPLLVDLVNTEATLLRVRVRTKMLERDMQDFYGRLRHIDRAAYERARLDRRVKALEEAYLMYAKKYEEARISYAMDQSRLVNVTLAEPVYVTPIAQRGTDQLGLLGAAVALLTGVGAAFLRESFSRSFTTEASVPRHLSLPLLGSVGNRRA
jgi:uncharacterized protein involved in exopolysaccharide biosynthesis